MVRRMGVAYQPHPHFVSCITEKHVLPHYTRGMAHLEILVHRGCLSEQAARRLAQELQLVLPEWRINVRHAQQRDADVLEIVVFPAFVLEGRVLVTGIPEKEWLLSQLRTWEENHP